MRPSPFSFRRMSPLHLGQARISKSSLVMGMSPPEWAGAIQVSMAPQKVQNPLMIGGQGGGEIMSIYRPLIFPLPLIPSHQGRGKRFFRTTIFYLGRTGGPGNYL